MPKKTQKRHEPGLALALIALIAPVLTAGIATSFAEGVSAPTHMLFDYSLFDGQSFLTNRRIRHAAPVSNSSKSSGSSSSTSSVSPCPSTTTSSASSESSVSSLSFADLTSTERDALRRQLRNYACPQKADAGYKALCEKMLKDLPPQETRTGLSNPNQ